MEVTQNIDVNQHLFNCFIAIRDPRVGGRVKHPLINILIITLCALIAGCDTWKSIELFAKERRKWLNRFIDLASGIPTHYTIARVFSLIDPNEFERCLVSWISCISDSDYGHGRIETREYTVLPVMYLPYYKQEWKGLETFVQVYSTRSLVNGMIETSARYYISSLPLKDFKRTCMAIRDHWQIENSLHHKLDVGLCEDGCPIYQGHAAENLGYMRKIILKLLNDETSCPGGVAIKRIKAALSTRYLSKVVGF